MTQAILEQCTMFGTHCMSCDNNGYCDNCGHQEHIVNNVLQLSTVHVPEPAAKFGSYRFVEHEYGWIVWVTEMLENTPDWLKPIVEYANSVGAVMIEFDADNSSVDSFKKYDW